MIFDTYELIAVGAATLAILVLGITHLRNNVRFYSRN